MRPPNLKPTRPSFRSKIFLDGGDPNETREAISLLGFLDGQTTNPTLISKSPEVAARLERGEKFTKEEVFNFYKSIVQEISLLIPDGSVSVEVYADKNTTSQHMLKMGREMFNWIPNAHIKFPTNNEGLAAAEQAIKEGLRVNMTLCFSQQQAAAVYAATKGAKIGQVFVSPFIGRLDDSGVNGIDLIKNIIEMYKGGDQHVQVLTASVRNLDHFFYAIKLGSDIITAPFKILKEWTEKGLSLPNENFIFSVPNLKNIPYLKLNLKKDWREFNIAHQLTDQGIDKFSIDWNLM